MNIVLIVVDSLRSKSVARFNDGSSTPFLGRLDRDTIHFRRAYASECWTLPAHCSIFTGLLPSEHGAHFQTMGYTKSSPTIAELLAKAGYHTEVITRNFVFDGTIPGVTRGFQKNSQPLAPTRRLHPFALVLAATKPRFRRKIRETGFFHPAQRQSREFLKTFARAMMPADRQALDYTLEQMEAFRRAHKPYFLFCNLYDVHAPYPPSPTSILRPLWTPRGLVEGIFVFGPLARLGSHAYLRPGFRLSERSRKLLLGRYESAIELMDRKLSAFYDAARGAGLLDDTLLVVTSDHGEAFGEHDLYLHDASVYDTHLHVPLWIHHPGRAPETVDDVVSTRDLFGVLKAVGLRENLDDTFLSAGYRAKHPIALAEHFYYPHVPDILPRYKRNLAAAIAWPEKIVVRGAETVRYDLSRDYEEASAEPSSADGFVATCRKLGIDSGAASSAVEHLRGWAG
jgi:arylsulfatase A-like enzyme